MGMIGNPANSSFQRVANDSFNGDGSTTVFTLSAEVTANTDIEVLVDNVQQSPYDGSYTASGTTLTFSAAPETGTNNIYVIYNAGHTFVTNTVGADNIQDGAVSANKIASGVIKSPEEAMTTQFGRRNLIINGAMQVAQRGTSGTSANAIDYYTVDRFNFRGEPTGVYTIAQDTDAPANFKNSTKITVTTPDTSIPSGERYWVSTILEGNDIAHLNFGSSDAQEITLSFYVKSSLTGTFSGGFGNDGFSRAYTFEYTIDSANTWERKTVTITGDTSGTWLDTNGVGLRIVWDLGAASNRQTTAGAWESSSNFAATGATQVIATNGATFYLTGVQLEVGSVATPFEHRSYGEELALCERYYQSYNFENYSGFPAVGRANGNPWGQFAFPLRTTMRAAPSGTWLGTNNGMIVVRVSDGTTEEPTSIDVVGASGNALSIRPETTNFPTGTPLVAISSGGGNQMYFEVDAEL